MLYTLFSTNWMDTLKKINGSKYLMLAPTSGSKEKL